MQESSSLWTKLHVANEQEEQKKFSCFVSKVRMRSQDECNRSVCKCVSDCSCICAPTRVLCQCMYWTKLDVHAVVRKRGFRKLSIFSQLTEKQCALINMYNSPCAILLKYMKNCIVQNSVEIISKIEKKNKVLVIQLEVNIASNTNKLQWIELFGHTRLFPQFENSIKG